MKATILLVVFLLVGCDHSPSLALIEADRNRLQAESDTFHKAIENSTVRKVPTIGQMSQ